MIPVSFSVQKLSKFKVENWNDSNITITKNAYFCPFTALKRLIFLNIHCQLYRLNPRHFPALDSQPPCTLTAVQKKLYKHFSTLLEFDLKNSARTTQKHRKKKRRESTKAAANIFRLPFKFSFLFGVLHMHIMSRRWGPLFKWNWNGSVCAWAAAGTRKILEVGAARAGCRGMKHMATGSVTKLRRRLMENAR